jgi:hypothetical protein
MINYNMPIQYIGTYEGEIRLGFAELIPANRYISRNELADSVHNGGNPTYSLEYPALIKNRNSNILMRGAWDVTWEWDAGTFTEAEVDQFINQPQYHPTAVATKDFANNTVSLSIVESNIPTDGWQDRRAPWILPARIATVTATSEASIMCVTILNGEYDKYSILSNTVSPGASITVEKIGDAHCYMVIGGPLMKDTTELSAYKAYKLTSPSVTLTNTGTELVRIVRISK